MSDQLKPKVISGVFWRMSEQIGAQGVTFVISIVLARLLEPKEFGIIALVTVFIALSRCFIDGGFGTALVQKQTVSEHDNCSVFYLSLSVSVVLYGVLFSVAPWIASFYKEPLLVPILRLLSLTVVGGALKSVQNAIMTREMKFRLSFKVSMISTVISGVVGVGMAYGGYGVWSLVWSALASQVASTVVMWIIVDWRPQLMFSLASVRQMFGFSSKLLASTLIDTLFSNLYNIIIGKLFNPTILGYYSRGQGIPNLVMSSIQGTIGSVMFPALASCQHDKKRVREIVRRSIKSSSFLVFPMMFGLAAVAKPLVLILLTEKWSPCVPYLQLSCITFALWPLHVANLQAVMALGRSDIFLMLEIVKKILIVATILVTVKFGVMAMVVGQAGCSFAFAVINAWPNRRLINYSLQQQVRDVLPAFLLATGMGVLVLGLEWSIPNIYFLFAAQIVVGGVFYLGVSKLLRFESAEYLWQTAQQFLLPRLKRAV